MFAGWGIRCGITRKTFVGEAMPQILEPVHVAMIDDEAEKSKECKGKPAKKGWKARINKGVGSLGDCDADRLYKAMKKASARLRKRPGKKTFTPKQSQRKWQLSRCGQTSFPLQAHHLIPKNHLPKHEVCAFLGAGAMHSLPFDLIEDTEYDTDHANNGYCLPYASALAEWKNASTTEKTDIAYRTRRQLHQGSHRELQYTADTEAAEEDDGDASSDHSQGPGYLAAVSELLDLVLGHAYNHTMYCEVCKPDDTKKTIYPREAVIRHVDQVSSVLKLLMDGGRIFVSKRAWAFANLTPSQRQRVAALTRKK
jgi:hypothetical protein